MSRGTSSHARWSSALCLLLLGSPAHATTIDFTAGWPSEATYSSNMGTTGGGVGITDFSALSANYLDGYVDIVLGASALSILSGKEVTIRVVRANSIDDGNFELNNLGTTSSPWTEYTTGTVTSVSSAWSSGYAGQLTVASSSTTDAYFQQYFPTRPGDVYRLSYSVNMNSFLPAWSPSATSYGSLEVRARYSSSASDAGVIYPAGPTTGYTGTAINTSASDRYELIASHTSGAGIRRVHQHVAVADCDDHTVFDDGALALTFTRYSSGSCSSAIQYGQITFLADAQSPSSSATIQIDDVMVDWVQQVEIEVLANDSSGSPTSTVIQSSTVDSGFYVEPLSSSSYPYGVTLRVNMRTHESGVTPILTKIFITDGLRVDATIGSSVATFTEPRLGLDMHLPPREQFDDYATYGDLTTECFDPDPTVDDYVPCYDLYADYNLTNVRMYLNPSSFDFTDNGIDDWDLTPNAEGESFLHRISEANDAGLDPLILLPAHGTPETEMSFWSDDCTDVLYDDLYGSTPRTDEEQSQHLFSRFALAVVEGMDGTQADFEYAEADDFEILNEPNLEAFYPDCDFILPEEQPALIDAAAKMLDEESTRTDINVAFAGLETGNGFVYDTSYLSADLLPDLDPSRFTNSAFHPYTKNWTPENILYRWPLASGILNTFGWSGTTPWFTEYAYKRAIYDPSCSSASEQSEWTSRGFGNTAQARMLARGTVAALATPAEKILLWGQMSNERVDGAIDECWEALRDNKVIFDRQDGTGLEFGGTDPAQYDPNEAGKAFLHLGRYLSTTSPRATSSVAVVTPAGYGMLPGDERYFVQVFDIDTGYAAVLWWYKHYTYGDVHTLLGESTDIFYQNLLYDEDSLCDTASACGVYDTGFTGERIHALRLLGLSSASDIDTVTMVTVGDGVETNPAFTYETTSGALRVDGVIAGEMPVILLLEDLY